MLLTLETLNQIVHSRQLKIFEVIVSTLLSVSILALSAFLVLTKGVTLNSGLGRYIYFSNFFFYWLQATSGIKFFDDAVRMYVATLLDPELGSGRRRLPRRILKYFAVSGAVRVATLFFAGGNLLRKLSLMLRYFGDTFLRVLVNVLVARIGYVIKENQRALKAIAIGGRRIRRHQLYRQLYTTCRRHFKLCDLFDDINAIMAVQTLCYFAITVQHVVYSFHATVNSFFKNHQEEFNLGRANNVVMGVIEAADVCLLIYNCTVASEMIQMYSLQMLHCKVKFSVLGFFQIDYSLFYSIFGGLATYLVLLIQFNDNGEGSYNGIVENVTILADHSQNLTVAGL